MNIKDGCRRPHLSTDRNHFRANTTKLLGEHLIQVSKKSDQWSRRRCDKEKQSLRTNGWTADGTQKIEIFPAESYLGCYGVAVLKHVKLISLKQVDCFM